MEQTYTPNLAVPAIRGWCLKYVDDAGDAPNRQPTASAAYEVERDAWRISGETPPEGLWAVGFLKFTKGAFTKEGHVFFIRNNGIDSDIYDSEVASGSRKPYHSIQELLAWFGAYSPTYIGWSTDCDGRQYLNHKGDNGMIIGTDQGWKDRMNRFHHQIVRNEDMAESVWESVQGGELGSVLVNWSDNPDAQTMIYYQELGQKASAEGWTKPGTSYAPYNGKPLFTEK